MERSIYGHMQTTHTTMPTMSSFKTIQKKINDITIPCTCLQNSTGVLISP